MGRARGLRTRLGDKGARAQSLMCGNISGSFFMDKKAFEHTASFYFGLAGVFL
jgi:hypothetical protein